MKNTTSLACIIDDDNLISQKSYYTTWIVQKPSNIKDYLIKPTHIEEPENIFMPTA